MPRVTVSQNELSQIAARLASTADDVRSQLDRVLMDVRRLEAEWIGGRTAPLIDALTTADRSRTELLAALDALRSYLVSARAAYEKNEASSTRSFGLRPASEIPSRSLIDLLGLPAIVSADDIERRWRRQRTDDVVPVGVGEDQQEVGIDLSTAPSVVIGGTTGSGKTELLRNLVAALALSFPPDYIALVLVDFKGGGAFGDLADLPHTAGVVSALDIGYTRRWLAQLEAILSRRQAGESVPQHLVVVIDEFAGLMDEDPRLVDALVHQIAQNGRSLGVHLVVSSQLGRAFPQELRASTNVRIGLRMLSREDSVDILGKPGAELLPARGEAFVADSSGVRRFRVAAPLEPDVARLIVTEAKIASDRRQSAAIRWPGPLPASVSVVDLAQGEPGAIPLGLVDLPRDLVQRVMQWRPRQDGHLLIWGPPASGKTTALQAIAEAATRAGFPTLPSADDPNEKVLRSRRISSEEDLNRLAREVRRRASSANQRPVIVLWDGLDEVQVDGNPLDRVLKAIRGPLSDGARLAVTSRRLTFGGEDLRHHFGVVIQLAPWQRTSDDLANPTPHPLVTARVPGRGLWDGNEVQVAHRPDIL